MRPVEAYLYGSDGKQPGDPRKAAEAIAAVDSHEPPLRLLLGTDAIELWEKKQAALKDEFARWRETGEQTAFEGASVEAIGG